MRAAGQAADNNRDRRKCAVERAGFQIHAAHLGQIDVEPAEKNPRHITETKIAGGDGEDASAGDDAAPASLASGRDCFETRRTFCCGTYRICRSAGFADQSELRRVHGMMLLWFISRDQIPEGARTQPDQRAHPKRGAPAVVAHHVADQAGSDARACSDARENHSIGYAALLRGNPLRDELVRRGVDNGFAGAQKKTHQHEKENGAPDLGRQRRGECGEYAPPHDAYREDASWAEAINQPATGSLKQSVTKQKSAEDPAEPNLA